MIICQASSKLEQNKTGNKKQFKKSVVYMQVFNQQQGDVIIKLALKLFKVFISENKIKRINLP